jgi:hypothetical protein
VTLPIFHEDNEIQLSGADGQLSEQQKNLVKLFHPTRYQLKDPTGEKITKMMEYWEGRPAGLEGPCEYTFRLITDAIDTHQGILGRGVIGELLQSAELLSADSTEALSAVLYPQNRQLSKAAREAEIERLWAAWHYIIATYLPAEIAKNIELLEAIKKIVVSLTDALGQDDSQVKLAQDTLKRLLGLAKNDRKCAE